MNHDITPNPAAHECGVKESSQVRSDAKETESLVVAYAFVS